MLQNAIFQNGVLGGGCGRPNENNFETGVCSSLGSLIQGQSFLLGVHMYAFNPDSRRRISTT